MPKFLEVFHKLRVKESLSPFDLDITSSTALGENSLKLNNPLGKKKVYWLKKDFLTQEFREIIGHGQWRWAALAWEAFAQSEGFSFISPLPKKGRSSSNPKRSSLTPEARRGKNMGGK